MKVYINFQHKDMGKVTAVQIKDFKENVSLTHELGDVNTDGQESSS